MRQVITVIGSQKTLLDDVPGLKFRDGEEFREFTWYACKRQDDPVCLLDDARSLVSRLLRASLLAYRFYLFVYNTKLWSGRRPLILIRGRSFSSRLLAYAGRWGGGDVVMTAEFGEPVLGPTRYILLPNGRLGLREY